MNTAEECSDAVTYATSFNVNVSYMYEESWSNYPKGCYVYYSGSVYFNSHPTGAKTAFASSICWKGN